MELLDLNVAIHVDTSELEAAIEKTSRLLALLREVQDVTDSPQQEKN